MKISQSPHSIHGFITSFLEDLKHINAKEPQRVGVKPPSSTQWQAPDTGCVKINVDAALMRTRAIGTVGALWRDHQGVFLGVSMITFHGVDDATTLEALAVQESLPLADDLYENRISVASACKVVIDDIG